MKISFEQMPEAIGQILERMHRLEAVIGDKLLKEPETPTGGRRIATANELAKYLKRPLSAVYQMKHKGIISGLKMPGSMRLYFDLDEIDNTFKNVSTTHSA